jgi:hypothetical protein
MTSPPQDVGHAKFQQMRDHDDDRRMNGVGILASWIAALRFCATGATNIEGESSTVRSVSACFRHGSQTLKGNMKPRRVIALAFAAPFAFALATFAMPAAQAHAAPSTVRVSAPPVNAGVAIVNAVPMNSKPIPGSETDHYSQGPNGSTIVTRTFAVAAPFTTSQGPNFNYTYSYSSNLRGRDMYTYSGRFCNVVDVINPGAPGQTILLSLYKNSGGQVSPTVRVSQPGTGWCWGGVQNNTDYHYQYSMDVGYYGYYITGSGHSYA